MLTKTGLFTDILPSGSGFITFEDSRQAFVLPTLIRRMGLQIGDSVCCRLVDNFSDKKSDRVPWRAIHVTLVSRSDPTLDVGAEMESLLFSCYEFLEHRGGSWTAEEVAGELGSVEVRFVSQALSILFSQCRIHRSVVYLSTSPDHPETFYALDAESLLPVGAVEDDEEVD